MTPKGTLLLSRQDVRSLLPAGECIDAVERVFRLQGEGKTAPPGILGIHARGGGFHIKAGLLDDGGKSYCVAKMNSNFPGNEARFSLPTIQGVVVLSDAENGYPLAVMDSIEITILRTGAATAVAAKYLSRADSGVVTICGCGNQGRIQLRSLLAVRPIKKVFAFDTDPIRARLFAEEFSQKSSAALSVEPIDKGRLASSVAQSDICVTCTTSAHYFLESADVAPGTFIAAVGADNEEKQELDPRLFVSNKVVADILQQCLAIGDLHHAVAAGLATAGGVYAELGEIVAGKKPGRTSDGEITIFDSTGMALQDAAAAILVYNKALTRGAGAFTHFN